MSHLSRRFDVKSLVLKVLACIHLSMSSSEGVHDGDDAEYAAGSGNPTTFKWWGDDRYEPG